MKKSDAGHMWVKLLLGLVYVVILVVFAIQTWNLVDWLFPKDQLFMKIVTVFSFDGTAALYTLLDMFYKFRMHTSRNIVKGMWYVAFGLSSLATVLEMYMASAGRLDFTYDPHFIQMAYTFVVVAFVANIVALTFFIRKEYEAFEQGVSPISHSPTPGGPQGGSRFMGVPKEQLMGRDTPQIARTGAPVNQPAIVGQRVGQMRPLSPTLLNTQANHQSQEQQ